MNVQEVRELKKFPVGVSEIRASDRAKICISKIPNGLIKSGNKSFIYRGVVTSIYENGVSIKSYSKGKSFKKALEEAFIHFDQRNRQMIGYEKRGLVLCLQELKY